ncbi:hypothetical protein [Mesorhizobium sp.]|uniref:hypothetical protein n=1 Tax=Mesorhizobium sp. TaxID=1871066 RepID=UPI0025D9B260|nr:hypothetical protein [Mesorhizobium sp.]
MDFGVFGHGYLSIGDLSTYHPRGVEMRFSVAGISGDRQRRGFPTGVHLVDLARE